MIVQSDSPARFVRSGYHARRGNDDKAKRCLERLYGSESTYDVEREYEAIAKVIDEERRAHGVVWWKEYRDCFTGTNGWVIDSVTTSIIP